MPDSLQQIERQVIACTRCPRLVAHCRQIAQVKRRAYRDWDYWGKPIPGFGDPKARLLVVGLAPAAHGGNRTGRVFTGDRSGDWLYGALHRAGFANQPTSVSRDDGLALRDAYVTAVVRCAPPDNRPTPAERDRCITYLECEIILLDRLRVFVALGGFAFTNLVRLLRNHGDRPTAPARFAHAARVDLESGRVLFGCYHPSQQNTFTGRLTGPMMDGVFAEARRLLDSRRA